MNPKSDKLRFHQYKITTSRILLNSSKTMKSSTHSACISRQLFRNLPLFKTTPHLTTTRTEQKRYRLLSVSLSFLSSFSSPPTLYSSLSSFKKEKSERCFPLIQMLVAIPIDVSPVECRVLDGNSQEQVCIAYHQ